LVINLRTQNVNRSLDLLLTLPSGNGAIRLEPRGPAATSSCPIPSGGIPESLPLDLRIMQGPSSRAAITPALRTIAAGLSLLATACTPADDPNRVDISVIGAAPKLGDPDRELLDPTRAVLMRETAMGLVAFDASGQIAPALAESWLVTDDGRSIVFRIHRYKWADGSEVTGKDVAASLNRAIAADSQNRLKPLLSAIDAVVGMTGRVVEIRLKTPRPAFLQLLAQPELGIRRKGTGLGPWRITGRAGNALVLRPVADPMADSTETDMKDLRQIQLKGGRAALAVARFVNGHNDLVLGGTAADWPIAQAARVVGTSRLRRDPVEGLFGLAVVPNSAFLKERSLRGALAMAIDRGALLEALDVPRWTTMERLLPAQLDSGQPPAQPEWAGNNMNERRGLAARRIAAWKSARGPIAPLRIALPDGPGMRVFFARLAADWRAVGISVLRVSASDAVADLRLIDEIAPNSSANWYLTRAGCDYNLSCSTAGDFALSEARGAPSLGQRAAAIARADAAYADHGGYIPIAKPLRWSLVSPALTRYRDNGFGVHPFAELRVSAKN
jgi:oligopeptide transport system substrate-binding protein